METGNGGRVWKAGGRRREGGGGGCGGPDHWPIWNSQDRVSNVEEQEQLIAVHVILYCSVVDSTQPGMGMMENHWESI